jgi:sugar phosphate isomerase/epimerase
MDLAAILPQVRRTGAEHIDIWPAPHANQRQQIDQIGHDQFLALLQEHNVRLGIVSRYDIGPFGLAEEIPTVRKLGGSMIVCGSRGPANLTGEDLTTAVGRFAEQLKPHLEAAAEHNITVAIENHANSLVCSPESMYRLMDAVASERIGIALAPYHLPQDPDLIAGIIRRLGPRLGHFYAWQYGKGCHTEMPREDELLQLPGRGAMDFGDIVAALHETRYDGWLEVFMHPYQRGTPILPTPSEITIEINRARAYLAACLPKGSAS